MMKRRVLTLAVLCLFAVNAFAAVHSIQVTIGAAATSITGPGNTICKWVVFQNNAAHNFRLGDSTVSATKGILLVTASPTGASFFIPPLGATGSTNLATWYVYGTQNDVVDVIYDDGL